MNWPIGKTILAKLTKKKYRKEYGLYLLEGAATVADAISISADIVGLIYDERALNRDGDLSTISLAKKNDIEVQELSLIDLKRISDLVTPPPVVAVAKVSEERQPTLPLDSPLVLALDEVADPGNLGTLLRAAAFYGIKEVWLGRGTAELYNPKVIRSTMAAHYHLNICENVDLAIACRLAQKSGAKVMATAVDGELENFPKLSKEEPGILLLGNEPHGLSEELEKISDNNVAIKRRGPIDSLNVAMAGTVLIDRLLNA